jgi:hypothetical protein
MGSAPKEWEVAETYESTTSEELTCTATTVS